jgi:hypothetical protein
MPDVLRWSDNDGSIAQRRIRVMAKDTAKKQSRRTVFGSIQSREPATPDKEPVHCQPVSPSDDSQARIAKRAYDLYLERGSRAGYALDDWLDAEREFLGLECNA